jgi:outer membrane protein TolC
MPFGTRENDPTRSRRRRLRACSALATWVVLSANGCVLNRALVWPESQSDVAATATAETLDVSGGRTATGLSQTRATGPFSTPTARTQPTSSGNTDASDGLGNLSEHSARPELAAPEVARVSYSEPTGPRRSREDSKLGFEGTDSAGSAKQPSAAPNSDESPLSQTSGSSLPNEHLAFDTPTIPPPAGVYPIDLTTALRLAEIENPQIAQARVGILEALAVQQGARALLLPSLNAGANYHGHTGNLQRSSGRILNLSEQSLYFGGGARVLAAETLSIPAVWIVSPLTDAIFEPLAARQRLSGARFEASATANSVLLEVALAHQELLKAEASLQVRRQMADDASEVARLTAVYALIGQGRESDANRAATELKHRQLLAEQAEEQVAVASARLARRLHLDQNVRLQTLESALLPIALVDLSSAREELIRVAMRQRPEVNSRMAAIGEAEARVRQELARPLLPLVWLGLSGGVFGGGSNLVPPLVGNFAGRTDIDFRAIWTLQNFGFGNLGLQRQRRSQLGEAVADQSLVINQVRREVAAAYSQALAARQQIDVAYRAIPIAEAGYREDFLRIKNDPRESHPIELVNSLDLLADAREIVLSAILNNNKAQFRLFVSLGSPPPLGSPPDSPLRPAPIASPPLPSPFAFH